MDSQRVIKNFEERLARNILPAPYEIRTGLATATDMATMQRLLTEMYGLAVQKGNWHWVELIQIECSMFLPARWILDNIPHKDNRLNQMLFPNSLAEGNEILSAYEFQRHLEPSSTQLSDYKTAPKVVPSEAEPCGDFRLKNNPHLSVNAADQDNQSSGTGSVDLRVVVDLNDGLRSAESRFVRPLDVDNGKLNQSETAGKRKFVKYTSCPISDCDYKTKHKKRHVENAHVPSLFKEDCVWTSDQVSFKRVEALEMLGRWISGNNQGSNLEFCMDFINRSDQMKDFTNARLTESQISGMVQICNCLDSRVPVEGFQFLPLNSPACLIHWRCLAVLLNAIQPGQRQAFAQMFGGIQGDVQDRSPALVASGSQDSQSVSAVTLEASLEGAKSEIKANDRIPMEAVSVPSGVLCAIDSHMHLDRMGCQMFGRKGLTATFNEILATEGLGRPSFGVDLRGVVAVYCDPETMPKSFSRDPRVKVVLGVHPCKVSEFTEERKESFFRLIQDPRVSAVGDIGYDLTEPADTWSSQLELLHTILIQVNSAKPLVLHIKGSNRSAINPYAKVFEIIADYCGRAKLIHLHCFNGTAEDVKVWLSQFRNCYFGFGALVSSFSEIQIRGLKEVPLNRILLETDSPYLPPVRGHDTNTPRFIGQVGELVAGKGGMEYATLMYWAYENAKSLYKF